MLNILRGLVLTLIILAVALFVGDWAVFRLRGTPHATVTVHHFVSAPLKDKQQELDYVGSEPTDCAIAMLPQGGEAPCWYLRRHANQVQNY